MALKKEDISNYIASVENTAELSNYWAKKYSSFLDKKIVIQAKTLQVLSLSKVTKPFTPSIDIILLAHKQENEYLDEKDLRKSVDIAVRMADSLLEKIKFSPEIANEVLSHRKISIGIHDFDEYTKQTNLSLNFVKYIGELLSKFVYRSSEGLAEEKGIFKKWDEYKQLINDKKFIYWRDSQNGDIKTSLEIKNNYSLEEIKNTSYEIIPRRNSFLIQPPISMDWVEFSDRDFVKESENLFFTAEKTSQAEQNQEPTQELEDETEKSPMFSDGELVKVIDQNSPYFNQILQIISAEKKSEKHIQIYKLKDTSNTLKLEENQLKHILLEEVLDKINQQKTPEKDHICQNAKNDVYFKQKIQENIEKIMSNYSLKLEKNIKTKEFGDVLISLSYKSYGLDSISLQNSKIAKFNEPYIQTILDFVNFCLQNEADKKIIAKILTRNLEEKTCPVVDLIKNILEEAPATIQAINPDALDSLLESPKNDKQREEISKKIKETDLKDLTKNKEIGEKKVEKKLSEPKVEKKSVLINEVSESKKTKNFDLSYDLPDYENFDKKTPPKKLADKDEPTALTDIIGKQKQASKQTEKFKFNPFSK